MKKKTLAAMLLAALVLTALPSCGGTSDKTGNDTTAAASAAVTEAAPVSAADAAKTLAEGCSFSEELAENAAYVQSEFPSAEYAECDAYVPAGITPEAVYVFSLNEGDDGSALVTLLTNYAEHQKTDYADYAPAQVPKLENPVILTNGSLVVYVVSQDNDAALALAKSVLHINN